jgi:hypothetical protein
VIIILTALGMEARGVSFERAGPAGTVATP